MAMRRQRIMLLTLGVLVAGAASARAAETSKLGEPVERHLWGDALFRQWTQADAILEYLAFAKRFVAECEERYGLSAVEAVLDAAHALMNQGVSRNARPRR